MNLAKLVLILYRSESATWGLGGGRSRLAAALYKQGERMDLSKLIPVSWRTTLAGVIAGLTIILSQLATLADDDPKTNPDLSAIAAAVAMMVGFGAARDRNVTSEQEGAK